jgi:hypothetical protein
MEQNENPYLGDRFQQFQEWTRDSPGERSVGSRQENLAVWINLAIQGGELRNPQQWIVLDKPRRQQLERADMVGRYE